MTRFLAALLAALLLAAPAASRAAAPGVAAASDLKFALDEIAAAWTRETGRPVRLAYGSSGNFRRQIAEGAPFELFLSADEAYVLALAREGRLEDEGTLYAVGRLVLFAPAGSVVDPGQGLAGLAALARAGRVAKLAIANPAHAPYGRAAKEALEGAGAWAPLAGRLVLGENVSQAAQFAASGNAAAGLFAYSLAFTPAVAGKGRFALVPESAHTPLRQRMALVKGAGEEARAFYRYLQGPAARGVFSRYGFALPGP
ncbi:MAG: molybdate ABC transporter substrate-binding protein [Betaproteobacteria bacterium]|nr:molybdate ABC transporter substrate-binding protein [Betaproteobacteria bacterium]